MKINEINRLVIEEGENFSFRFDPSPYINPNAQLSQRTLYRRTASSLVTSV